MADTFKVDGKEKNQSLLSESPANPTHDKQKKATSRYTVVKPQNPKDKGSSQNYSRTRFFKAPMTNSHQVKLPWSTVEACNSNTQIIKQH